MQGFNILLFLGLLPPVLLSFFAIFYRSRKVYLYLSVLFSIMPILNFSSLFILISSNTEVYFNIGKVLPGLEISFSATKERLAMCLLVSILYPISVSYAIGYANQTNMVNVRRFFIFFHFSIFSALLLFLSDNLFTMFIFYEVITASTYPLIIHNESNTSKRSGRIYISYLMISSTLLFLPAMLIVYGHAGTLTFASNGIISGMPSGEINLLMLMFVLGIAKTAIFPVFYWLPSAMIAPTPVSALLHAVVVVKSGVFTLLSVMYFIFGKQNLDENLIKFFGQNWIIILSSVSIIISSISAILSDKIKTRLAYSTISSISYAIFCAAMFNDKSISVCIVGLFSHAFAKISLFFASGAIYMMTKKDKVSQMIGIGRHMPITMAVISISCISLIGLPVTLGFQAKYMLLKLSFIERNAFAIMVILLSSILTLSYFFPIIYNSLFAPSDDIFEYKKISEPNRTMIIIPMVLCSALTIFGFIAAPILKLYIST